MEIWVIDGLIERSGEIELLDGCLCKNQEDAEKIFNFVCTQYRNTFVDVKEDKQECKNESNELLERFIKIKSVSFKDDFAMVRMSKFMPPAEFFKSK